MRQSQLFTKTSKQAPKGEDSENAKLLERAGFVHKNFAGVYSYLPLGLLVLKNIERIIREEMNAIGGQELLLNTLQDPEIWKKSNRWDDKEMDVWFKTALKNGSELGIGNTHEEPLADVMRHHVQSYKDLPVYAYQFQTKFRNELRAKSGLMRVREFIMKDLYSFTETEGELEAFYEKAAEAYMRIFARAGLGDVTFRTFASGGAFSKFSDEFQTISDAGEDTIYLDRKKKIAVNKEVYRDDVLKELGLDKESLEEVKAIEVGNIFKLGTRFSEAEGLLFTNEAGEQKPVIMGSYGIGLGRLVGTIVEVRHDEAGIIWPEEVAPFRYHLLTLSEDESVTGRAQEIYDTLTSAGRAVLWDDRAATNGAKLADADLIGIPHRLVVSPKTGEKIEYKNRAETEIKLITTAQLLK